MPPARPRPQPEDSRSEASSTKERVVLPGMSSNALNGKNRRVAGPVVTGSSLRDVVTTAPSGFIVREDGVVAASADANPGIQWSTFEPEILHGYRRDYRLSTPASFKTSYNQLILSRSPIGRMSPTMAQRKEERRQSNEQLASAARKHFNSMGIVENDVVVDFLYKVRWQDKKFRKRFAPPRPR